MVSITPLFVESFTFSANDVCYDNVCFVSICCCSNAYVTHLWRLALAAAALFLKQTSPHVLFHVSCVVHAVLCRCALYFACASVHEVSDAGGGTHLFLSSRLRAACVEVDGVAVLCGIFIVFLPENRGPTGSAESS